MSYRPRTAPTGGFTLIELLVVIAIIGVLAALLLPTLTAVRCRSKESAAQSIIRDMESAIKAYESDYAAYPRDDGGYTAAGVGDNTGNCHNQRLVFALARPGSRGTAYYSFRRDFQGTAAGAKAPAGGVQLVDQLVAANAAFSTATWPCFYSPLAAFGGASVQNINMYFYNENQSNTNKSPGGRSLFNPFSFDMWTGSCVPVGGGATPVDQYGGNSVAGQGASQINNWR